MAMKTIHLLIIAALTLSAPGLVRNAAAQFRSSAPPAQHPARTADKTSIFPCGMPGLWVTIPIGLPGVIPGMWVAIPAGRIEVADPAPHCPVTHTGRSGRAGRAGSTIRTKKYIGETEKNLVRPVLN